MRAGLAGVGVAIASVTLALSTSAAAVAADYSSAPFQVTNHSYAFGQAPVFMPNGKQVLFGKDFRTGDKNQVYIANFDGSGVKCLTCTGPGSTTDNVNGVPAVRPRATGSCFTPGAAIT